LSVAWIDFEVVEVDEDICDKVFPIPEGDRQWMILDGAAGIGHLEDVGDKVPERALGTRARWDLDCEHGRWSSHAGKPWVVCAAQLTRTDQFLALDAVNRE
jgi:hypothetical protein